MGDLEDNYIIYVKDHSEVNTIEGWKHMLAQSERIKGLGDNYWFNKEMTEEEKLRKKYPAAADAWDKYQEIIKLVQEADNVKSK